MMCKRYASVLEGLNVYELLRLGYLYHTYLLPTASTDVDPNSIALTEEEEQSLQVSCTSYDVYCVDDSVYIVCLQRNV